MFPWQRREVLITNSAVKFGRAQTALRDDRIGYDTKVFDNGADRASHRMGRFGGRADVEVFYYIYVRKDDKERAEYLINLIR